MSHPDSAPSAGTPAADVSPWWLAAALLRARRTILLLTGTGLLVGLTIALVRPRAYTATFAFLPQAGSDATRAGLAGLAGQFGINLGNLGGNTPPPQLYADLLTSREVLAPVALDSVPTDSTGARVPLADFLAVKGRTAPLLLENTVRELRREVISSTVALRTTGMVTVSVRTRSPQASLAIATRLLERLNHFNLVTRQSQAREERRFTEARLSEAQLVLRAAEDAQERFLRTNRQIDGSPALRFENDRLQRVVQLQQQVVTTLAQQLEENRIREVRDTPVITVYEPPVLPARPDPGLRALILALGTVAGFLVGVFVVLTGDAWRRLRETSVDPALDLFRREWSALWSRGRA